MLSESDSEALRESLQAVMAGYSRFTTQPRAQPAHKGGHVCRAEDGDDSWWAVRRHLESTDFRRWPPALQALLRRLFASVAADAEAEPRKRNAATVRLARLQVSTSSKHFPSTYCL